MGDADELRRAAQRLRSGRVTQQGNYAALLALHDQVLAAARRMSMFDVRAERLARGTEPTEEELVEVISALLDIWSRDDNAPMISPAGAPIEGRFARGAPQRADIAEALRRATGRGLL